MSTPEHAPRPIRRRYRAYDLADPLEKSLMLFVQSVMSAKRHLMALATEPHLKTREYHREAARSEAKCARICWQGLVEAGYEDRKGVCRA